MSNYLASPQSSPKAGILLLHAWWGLNDFFKELSDKLANEGYLVIAPDLYDGKIAQTIPEAEKLVSKIKRKNSAELILASLDELKSQPGIEKIGVIGFSMGAFWSMWLNEERPADLSATVLFYGARGGKYLETKSAFCAHFAETDPYESESSKKALEKAFKSGGKTYEFYTYPGTGHWFCENDRPEFNPEAAELAWQRTLAFLKNTLS